jgi:hypothetical protein
MKPKVHLKAYQLESFNAIFTFNLQVMNPSGFQNPLKQVLNHHKALVNFGT